MPIQLSFSIRVSSNVKSIHLVGSWDGYTNQLPLSRDKTASKPGAWKATFRFSSSQLTAGDRYWYYYILDGYHCAHNPGLPSTVEPTTQRELNILDMPGAEEPNKPPASSSSHKSSSSSSSSSKKHSSSSSSRASKAVSLTVEIPRGRPLSVSEIKSPKPMSPNQTKTILTFPDGEMDDLAALLARSDLSEEDEYRHYVAHEHALPAPISPVSDDEVSTFSSSSSSGYSTPGSELSDSCSCERFGLTRSGQRVRIDCGGAVCGYIYDSDCSVEDKAGYASRRNGVVVS
jgi:hypothetical protein